MDTEDKIKLERALELSEENNKILKKMHRAMRWGRLVKTIYWVVIIGISVGAFYYVQPYFDQILKVYGGVVDTAGDINSFFSPR